MEEPKDWEAGTEPEDLQFVLAQLAFLKDGLTDPDVIWEMRVRYVIKEVEERGLKVEL